MRSARGISQTTRATKMAHSGTMSSTSVGPSHVNPTMAPRRLHAPSVEFLVWLGGTKKVATVTPRGRLAREPVASGWGIHARRLVLCTKPTKHARPGAPGKRSTSNATSHAGTSIQWMTAPSDVARGRRVHVRDCPMYSQSRHRYRHQLQHQS